LSSPVAPGEHLEVSIQPFPYQPVAVDLGESELDTEISGHWWEDETLYLIIGFSYHNEPGKYDLTLHADYFGNEGMDKSEGMDTKELEVEFALKDRDYPEQSFSVSGNDTQEWCRDELREQRERMSEARQITYPSPLWTGSFLSPVEGNVTSEYGAIRIINDNPPRRHAGIDLGGLPEGTPVKAAQDGIVRLAESLLAPGKTVIIDHGLGLNSSYLHLHEIKVVQDQRVEKGDVIGTLGQTGFATGPHLHWEIRLEEMPLDPNKFLENPLGFQKKYNSSEGVQAFDVVY